MSKWEAIEELSEQIELLHLKLDYLTDSLLSQDRKRALDEAIKEVENYRWQKRMGEEL